MSPEPIPEDEQAHGPAARPGTQPPGHRLHQLLLVPEPGLLPVLLLPGEEKSHLGCEENLLPLRHLRPALHLPVVDHRAECELEDAKRGIFALFKLSSLR